MQGSPKKICLLDWQVSRYASPGLDIAYYLLSSTSKELWDQYYDQLIQIYYTSLSDIITHCGSDPSKLFSFENLQEHLKKFAIFGVIMAPTLLSVMLSDPENCADMEKLAEKEVLDLANFDEKTEKRYKQRVSDVLQFAKKQEWINLNEH